MTQKREWNIPKDLQVNPNAYNRPNCVVDLREKDRAVIWYDVEEVSMLQYVGRLAVLENFDDPKVIMAPQKLWTNLEPYEIAANGRSSMVGFSNGWWNRVDESGERPLLILDPVSLRVGICRLFLELQYSAKIEDNDLLLTLREERTIREDLMKPQKPFLKVSLDDLKWFGVDDWPSLEEFNKCLNSLPGPIDLFSSAPPQ